MDSNFRGGNPVMQLGNYTAVQMPQKRIRCLVGDFYIGEGNKVAEVGRTYTLDADVARALVEFRRAEYVK